MNSTQLNILLAEDDQDDRDFFAQALEGIPVSTNLTTVNDGEQLMDYLHKNAENLPHLLFLDINMPRKSGVECLFEIKEDVTLKDIVVVMFSTSFPRDTKYEEDLICRLLKIGAHDFIRKSQNLVQLKQFIHQAIISVVKNKSFNQQGDN